MNFLKPRYCVAGVALLAMATACAAAEGDAERGAKVYQACMACHSLEAGQHMTGPSLASIWGRKAGTVEGFRRYSDALKRSGVVWNEKSMDAWLRDPAALVPGNWMMFQGIKDAQPRNDLIAFMKAVSEGGAPRTAARGGMMGPPQLPDLKKLDANSRVSAIRYCADTYHVTLESGAYMAFWEFNLRFKTDSSERGPVRGKPVLVPAGMMGDRAQAVFSSPEEISAFIKHECEGD
jgi:cytochrome c